jgi:protein sidekick
VVQTLQGIPGPPSNLKFSEITMNTLKVGWDLPVKPNGEIIGYIVAYETAEQDESKFEFFCSYWPRKKLLP